MKGVLTVLVMLSMLAGGFAVGRWSGSVEPEVKADVKDVKAIPTPGARLYGVQTNAVVYIEERDETLPSGFIWRRAYCCAEGRCWDADNGCFAR